MLCHTGFCRLCFARIFAKIKTAAYLRPHSSEYGGCPKTAVTSVFPFFVHLHEVFLHIPACAYPNTIWHSLTNSRYSGNCLSSQNPSTRGVIPGLPPFFLHVKPLEHLISHQKVIPGCTSADCSAYRPSQNPRICVSLLQVVDGSLLSLFPWAAFVLCLPCHQPGHTGAKFPLQFLKSDSCILHSIVQNRCRNQLFILCNR